MTLGTTEDHIVFICSLTVTLASYNFSPLPDFLIYFILNPAYHAPLWTTIWNTFKNKLGSKYIENNQKTATETDKKSKCKEEARTKCLTEGFGRGTTMVKRRDAGGMSVGGGDRRQGSWHLWTRGWVQWASRTFMGHPWTQSWNFPTLSHEKSHVFKPRSHKIIFLTHEPCE